MVSVEDVSRLGPINGQDLHFVSLVHHTQRCAAGAAALSSKLLATTGRLS